MNKKVLRNIVILTLIIGVGVIIFSDSYFGRYIRWNLPDVYDLDKFPKTTISPSETDFIFPKVKNGKIETVRFDYKGDSIDLSELAERTRTNSIIVIKNDTLVFEKYLNNNDGKTCFKAFSATKSLLSILIGIAIDRGEIQNVNDSIGAYISDLKDSEISRLTLKQCLMQKTGIEYNGSYVPWADEPRWYYDTDVRSLTKDKRINKDKKQEWCNIEYNVLLLGMVLENATNTSISNYLETNLWKKIGTKHIASFSIDSDKERFEKVGDGFNPTSIDFIKFGYLLLNNGVFNSDTIVSTVWIDKTTDFQFSEKTDRNGVRYNSLWWVKENGDFYAEGHYGQYLYISPDSKTVMVRFGEERGGVSWWYEIFPQIIDGLR